MVQSGCHKGSIFLFLLQSFRTLGPRFSGTTSVAFHIRVASDEPSPKRRLTGPEGVTNNLSLTSADNYNAAHVRPPKHLAPPAGPAARLFTTCRSGCFLADSFRFSVVNSGHAAQR